MPGVQLWLDQLGLAQYGPSFEANAIDAELLPDLSDTDLQALGVQALGHRKRLLKAIAELSGPPQAAPAERRQITVMFCDLVGSSALAEQLDPEDLRDLMQTYQRACSDVVARHDGHVAQYLGDGLMVYFGWPQAHDDNAARAVHAALEVSQAIAALKLAAPIQARVGIHTGVVVVGETGQGDASIPKAAVGETPNVAARLQALAEPGTVVVSERTRSLLGSLFEFAELGSHALKGLSTPMRLYQALSARATTSRFDAARSGLALTALVGREAEQAQLLRCWRRACAGSGQLVLVSGEAGIGKSRLVLTLREHTAATAQVVLRYQCSPYHANSPQYPMIEQITMAAGFSRDDPPERKLDKLEALLVGDADKVAELAPLMALLLSLPVDRYPALKLSPQQIKEKTTQAFVDQIEALAQRQPLLMIFEDVHWIDPSSQEILDRLVARIGKLPVLIELTFRPEYLPRWAASDSVTTLGLSRLDPAHAAQLVAGVTAGKQLPAEVLDQILAHTDGVPLFVEELTKSVLESGLLLETGDHYSLHRPLPAMAIPTSLRDSLLARLDRLAPVKFLIQIGACIGREFGYELVAMVSGLADEALVAGLDKLIDAGLISRRGTPPQASYTFKHALMQDAAYDFLLKSSRLQLHARIAQALEQGFSDQVANKPELLAHHHTRAGNLLAAIALWHKAGELALQRVALQEALAHLQQGLALIAQLPVSAERDALELSVRGPLNAVWTGLRGWAAPEVGSNASSIVDLAARLGDHQGLLMGAWGMWSHTITGGRIADSLAGARHVLAQGDHTGDADLQCFGHALISVTYYYLGRLVQAREQGRHFLALYTPQRASRWMKFTSIDLRTFFAIWSTQWTWMLGQADQAVLASDAKDQHARQLGNLFNLGYALTAGAYVFEYRCEPEHFLQRIDEIEALTREQSIPFLSRVQIPLAEGLVRLRLGQLPEATALLRQAITNWTASGGHVRVPFVKSALAEALALQGDLSAGLALIDEALEQIERPGWQERSHLAEVLRLKGWMLLRQGRSDEAEAALQASLAWARQQQALSWQLRSATTLAGLWQSQGRFDSAQQLLAPILGSFTEGFETRDLLAAKVLLDELGSRPTAHAPP